jgi:hypothetical protein
MRDYGDRGGGGGGNGGNGGRGPPRKRGRSPEGELNCVLCGICHHEEALSLAVAELRPEG